MYIFLRQCYCTPTRRQYSVNKLSISLGNRKNSFDLLYCDIHFIVVVRNWSVISPTYVYSAFAYNMCHQLNAWECKEVNMQKKIPCFQLFLTLFRSPQIKFVNDYCVEKICKYLLSGKVIWSSVNVGSFSYFQSTLHSISEWTFEDQALYVSQLPFQFDIPMITLINKTSWWFELSMPMSRG